MSASRLLSQWPVVVLMSLSTPVGAHEFPVLEAVVVTVQRREEWLQKVPIAASAFSALQLERAQIGELGMLQYVSPNMTNAPSQTTRTSASIAMRGQFVRDTTPTIDPPVGLYLDGVYIARMPGANLALIDMERVEVLRGPQGTLFGRNTIGGAINLIARKPTRELEGYLKAGTGNFDRAELAAVVNVPFAGDRYALRITASHIEHGGYGHNSLLDAELDDDHTDFLRTQLNIAPAERWNFNLSFDYSRTDTAGQLRTLLYVAPGAVTIPAALGNLSDSLARYVDPVARSVSADNAGTVETSTRGVTGTLTVELAEITVKSISAYRELDASALDSEQDGTPYDLGTILYRYDRQHQLSEELQLYGDAMDDRMDWIGGVLYFEESGSFNQEFRAFVPLTTSWSTNIPSGDVENDSFAAYLQVGYAITPRLRLMAGVRYNEDGRQLTSRNARRVGTIAVCRLDPTLLDEPGLCRATMPEREFHFTPWTIGLEYRPVDTAMLYAKTSRGHRSGGYNLRGVTQADLGTFEPEQVTAYELGAKLEFFTNRLRLNLALFQTRFEDIQITQREATAPGIPGIFYTANGGEAKIEGGELEVTALLGSVRLSGYVGFTKPAFTKLDPRVVEITLDSRFVHTPDWTASLAVDLPFNAGFGEVNIHGDYSWRSDVSYSYDRDSPARQAAYGLLNMKLSSRFTRANLELSVWARNMLDERYIVRAFESDYYISAMPGDPRTIGVSLTYDFGAS